MSQRLGRGIYLANCIKVLTCTVKSAGEGGASAQGGYVGQKVRGNVYVNGSITAANVKLVSASETSDSESCGRPFSDSVRYSETAPDRLVTRIAVSLGPPASSVPLIGSLKVK